LLFPTASTDRYAFLSLRRVCPNANAPKNQLEDNKLKGSRDTFSKRKKNKKASKIRWLRSMPTLNKKSKRLRHNGKANMVASPSFFVALPPFGTYSVSFWLFCPATFSKAFFFFCFFLCKKVLVFSHSNEKSGANLKSCAI
jgi:hypothetical protein